MDKIFLIGGSNIDYIATSENKLINKVSNIGTLSISQGGVMRNICENMARLGNSLNFITALGNDENGRNIKSKLEAFDVKLYCPKTSLKTSTYLAVNDYDHDMAIAICDNKVINEVSPLYLQSIESELKDLQYLLIDTNLSQECIDYLFDKYGNKKIMADAISPTKGLKLSNRLNKLFFLKCNIHEAKVFFEGVEDAKELANLFLKSGVKNIVISNGSKDIIYGSNNEIKEYSVPKITDYNNTIGCGDALFSGIADKLIQNISLKEAIEFGIKLSNIIIQSESATSNEVDSLKYKH